MRTSPVIVLGIACAGRCHCYTHGKAVQKQLLNYHSSPNSGLWKIFLWLYWGLLTWLYPCMASGSSLKKYFFLWKFLCWSSVEWTFCMIFGWTLELSHPLFRLYSLRGISTIIWYTYKNTLFFPTTYLCVASFLLCTSSRATRPDWMRKQIWETSCFIVSQTLFKGIAVTHKKSVEIVLLSNFVGKLFFMNAWFLFVWYYEVLNNSSVF